MLHKPNLSKPAFKIFPEKATMIAQHKCADCGKIIKEDEFVDSLSKREYEISGLCQKCQDDIFG